MLGFLSCMLFSLAGLILSAAYELGSKAWRLPSVLNLIGTTAFVLLVLVVCACRTFIERIVLADQSLSWISWTGRTVARIDLETLTPGSLNYSLAPAKFKLRQGADEIRFASEINGLGQLLELVVEREFPGLMFSSRESGLEGQYRYKHPFMHLAFVAGIFPLATYIVVNLSREVHFSWAVAGAWCWMLGLPLAKLLADAVRRFRENIVVSGRQITWFDWRGKAKLRSSLDHVVPGTMTWRAAGALQYFEVQTEDGPLRWDSSMRDAKGFANAIRKIARQPSMPLYDDLSFRDGFQSIRTAKAKQA